MESLAVRLIVVLLALTPLPASAARISYGFGFMELWAGDSTSDLNRTFVPFGTLSTSVSEVNAVNGARVDATYLFSDAEIFLSYDLLRPPFHDGPALGGLELAELVGSVGFTVDELVSYELDAQMTTLDSEGRNTFLWLQLFENDVRIFNNAQGSRETPNQNFYLGATDGDFSNSLSGSLTGVLIPGYSYRFEYYSRLLDDPSPSLQEATANGFFSLQLVPEPGTALLLGLGLGLLGRSRSAG